MAVLSPHNTVHLLSVFLKVQKLSKSVEDYVDAFCCWGCVLITPPCDRFSDVSTNLSHPIKQVCKGAHVNQHYLQ